MSQKFEVFEDQAEKNAKYAFIRSPCAVYPKMALATLLVASSLFGISTRALFARQYKIYCGAIYEYSGGEIACDITKIDNVRSQIQI